jgi:hypothetical protein
MTQTALKRRDQTHPDSVIPTLDIAQANQQEVRFV